METKAMSFVLASLLLFTAWVMAPPPVERAHSHPLIKATPAPPPEKPLAPSPPPENHHYHHAPKKAPVHAPYKHHHPHAPKYECKSRCEEHCKKEHHKKEKQEEKCVKACITCCCGSKHSPERKKGCKWSHMRMEGKRMKCY